MKKQQEKNNTPEEWELTLTLEPEEEEQPEPGTGSAFGALCYTESTKGDFYARI